MSITTWGHAGLACRIRAGWDGAGRTGECFAAVKPRTGVEWAVVKWDDEDDMECFKLSGLQFKYSWDHAWRNAP